MEKAIKRIICFKDVESRGVFVRLFPGKTRLSDNDNHIVITEPMTKDAWEPIRRLASENGIFS